MIDTGILISLKDEEWLRRQKIAGRAVSNCLTQFARMMKDKAVANLLDVESMCVRHMELLDCTPTFKNYKPREASSPFPGNVCLSVNQQVVHGIPKNYELKEGDIVTLDLGATFEGAIADSAFTAVYGGKAPTELAKRMLVDCQRAMLAGVKAAAVGKRTGVIGHAIHSYAKKTPFGLIVDFGGHGINYNQLHAPPFIENKARENSGVIIEPGLSIAIEPMLTITKNTNTRLLKDGWTIITKGISCHYEHSVTFAPDGTKHIITDHSLKAEDYS